MMHVEVQLSLLSVQLSHTHTMMGEKKSIAQEPSRGVSLSDGAPRDDARSLGDSRWDLM